MHLQTICYFPFGLDSSGIYINFIDLISKYVPDFIGSSFIQFPLKYENKVESKLPCSIMKMS